MFFFFFILSYLKQFFMCVFKNKSHLTYKNKRKKLEMNFKIVCFYYRFVKRVLWGIGRKNGN